jgi:hypothetical protein
VCVCVDAFPVLTETELARFGHLSFGHIECV